MLFYKILEGIGVLTILIGITAVENPWYVPVTFMAAGAAIIGVGAWGEKDMLRRRKKEKYDKA